MLGQVPLKVSAFSSSPSKWTWEARWDTAACQQSSGACCTVRPLKSCFFCFVQPSSISWGWAGNSIANRSNRVATPWTLGGDTFEDRYAEATVPYAVRGFIPTVVSGCLNDFVPPGVNLFFCKGFLKLQQGIHIGLPQSAGQRGHKSGKCPSGGTCLPFALTAGGDTPRERPATPASWIRLCAVTQCART